MYRRTLLLFVGSFCLGAETKPRQRPRSAPAKPVARNASNNAGAKEILSSLTLRQKIAQLIIIAANGDVPARRSAEAIRLNNAVGQLEVGGLIVINGVDKSGVRNAEPYELMTLLNGMQKLSRLPLIVGSDMERGASMRVSKTTKYPHNMAFNAAGDLGATMQLGAATAREARTLGVHWIFAPVADVNNNPDNPVISIRSFGQRADEVASHVQAYIEGAHSDPNYAVLVCAKHFPGHGDTALDSHLGLARIEASRERIDAVELVPFRAAIAGKVDSIMTAHIAVPAIEPAEIPATISAKVITKLLREELNFKGLITTDAMDMQGLAKMFPPGEAAVRALEAGVDILLMPKNPAAVIAAVEKAVLSKRLTVSRIEASVEKLLNAKIRLGLFKNRFVDPKLASGVLDQPEDAQLAQSVANRAVAIFKNAGNIVPIRDSSGTCFTVLIERRTSQQGMQFLEEISKLAPNASQVLLDPTMLQGALDETLEKSRGCRAIVVAAFVTLPSFRGDTPLPGNFTALVQGFIKTGRPVVLISLGNPYLLRSFPDVTAYLTTYSPTVPSETAAARAVTGEIPITGRTVISLK